MKKYLDNVKLNKETKIKLNKKIIKEDLRHLLTQVSLKYDMMIERRPERGCRIMRGRIS